jgi:hypothetical protein
MRQSLGGYMLMISSVSNAASAIWKPFQHKLIASVR